MLTIPADIILEKNKLYSGEAFIELLEWQISEISTTIRVANYNEDVDWNSETWTRFRFEGGGETDSGGDSSEAIQVKVSAVDKIVQTYLEALANGSIGDTVIYRRVHSGNLDLGAALTATFEIVDVDAGPSNEWVIFNLGQENFFLSQFPANVTRRDVCRYRPSMTSVCSYVNNSACDRSFASCVYFGQESVFGGQPGIPGGVFNLFSAYVAAAPVDHDMEDTAGTRMDDTAGTRMEDTVGWESSPSASISASPSASVSASPSEGTPSASISASPSASVSASPS